MKDQLSNLAKGLVARGPGPFHSDLIRLATQVRCSAPGAAAVLADPESPDVLRLRAFSVAVRHVRVRDTDRAA